MLPPPRDWNQSGSEQVCPCCAGTHTPHPHPHASAQRLRTCAARATRTCRQEERKRAPLAACTGSALAMPIVCCSAACGSSPCGEGRAHATTARHKATAEQRWCTHLEGVESVHQRAVAVGRRARELRGEGICCTDKHARLPRSLTCSTFAVCHASAAARVVEEGGGAVARRTARRGAAQWRTGVCDDVGRGGPRQHVLREPALPLRRDRRGCALVW